MISARQFPTWVPQWVRDEYLIHLDGWVDTEGPYDYSKVFHEIVFSQDTKAIWKALEKRKAAFERWVEASTRSKHDRRGMVATLTDALVDSIQSYEAESRFSRKEMSERAKTIEKLAKKLSKNVRSTYTGSVPQRFQQKFRSELSVLIDRMLVEHSEEVFSLHLRWPRLVDPFYFDREKARHLFSIVVRRIPDLVEGIALAAMASLAGTGDPTVRAGAGDAKRRFVLRRLRSYFSEAYGTPLHQTNLALVGIFFDCSDLSVANVATITRPAVSKLASIDD